LDQSKLNLHTGLPCPKCLIGIAFQVKSSKVKFTVTINRKSLSAVCTTSQATQFLNHWQGD